MAAEFEINYDSSSAGFGSDLVEAVPGEGGMRLNIGGDDGDVVRIAGDALEVAGDLEIVLSNNVRVVFSSAVSVGGNLSVGSRKVGILLWEAPEGARLSESGYELLYPGAQLADYEIYSTDYGSRGDGISGVVRNPHFVRETDGEVSCQFQQLTTEHTKVVKISAIQSPEGIMCRKMYSKYILGNSYGKDFDVLPGTTSYPGHYNITQMSLKLKVAEDVRSVRFGGALAVAGEIDVAGGVYAVCEKVSSLLDENGVFDKDVSVNVGAFLFASPERSFTLAGNFSGDKAIVGFVENESIEVPELEERTYSSLEPGAMAFGNGWVKMFENTSLADVVDVRAYACGNTLYAVNEYKNVLLPSSRLFSDEWRLTCEFQLLAASGDHYKGMGIALKQLGNDIYGYFQYAGYLILSHYPEVKAPGDWIFSWSRPLPSGGSGSVGNSLADPSGYSMSNLTITVRRPAGQYRGIDVALSNACTMTDTDLVLGGSPAARLRAAYTDKNKASFPVSGRIVVKDSAMLELGAGGYSWDGSGFNGKNGAKLEIEPGGALHTAKSWQLSDSHKISIDGGTVALGVKNAEDPKRYEYGWNDAGTYCGNLTYSNGGKSIGSSPRMGKGNTSPTFFVNGTVPCHADHGVQVVVSSFTTLKFNVEDVTGDGRSDFSMSGKIAPFDNNHTNFQVVKTGAGTFELTGANDYTRYPTKVEAGTLRLGASGVMHGEMDLLLAGGDFAVSPGTENTLGALKVTAGATVKIEPGAALAFADSSAEEWDLSGGRINIVKDKTSTVRFGESSSALTATQLRAIRVNGHLCGIDENGYLDERSGTVMILR